MTHFKVRAWIGLHVPHSFSLMNEYCSELDVQVLRAGVVGMRVSCQGSYNPGYHVMLHTDLLKLIIFLAIALLSNVVTKQD